MTTLGERLKHERESWPAPPGARWLTQDMLAKRAGVSQTTIADIERGRNQGSKELPMIAAALNLHPLWLLEGRGPKYADPALARRMGRLPPGADEPPAVYGSRFVLRPSCSIPILNQTEIEMYRELIQHPEQAQETLTLPGESDGTLFALRMDDDSMATGGDRSLPPGWYAVADADRTPDIGDLVIVRLEDGRAYCRQYVADAGGRLLKPANSHYSSRMAPTDPGAYLGVVIGRHYHQTWE